MTHDRPIRLPLREAEVGSDAGILLADLPAMLREGDALHRDMEGRMMHPLRKLEIAVYIILTVLIGPWIVKPILWYFVWVMK